ncbi:MAG: PD40 domain-containing protein [Anaerolineae bacterium]|nr:PD40 domain-containing protein [Phycisphaerae bacterium]
MIKRCIGPAIFAVMCSFLFAQPAHAAVQGYYRFPTVSGDQIVFMCEGDLWKVSTAGGAAMRLTSHPGTESLPRLSPDGKMIAFSADYQGNGDVYVMPSDGGEPKRLTFHPSQEQCAGWTPDGKYVIYRARRGGLDSDDTMFKIPVEGGEPEIVNVGVCSSATFSADQKMIAFNPFTWGGTWKRYRGGTAPKIWVGDLEKGKFWKMAENDAVDQHPVWVGDRIYFMSERTFPVNVWSCKPDGSDAKQMTKHTDYDVRSIGTDGKKVVYSAAADIWLLDVETGKANRVDVLLPSDRIRERARVEDASKSIESFDLSNDGKRITIGARGELWTAPAKPGGRIIKLTDNDSGIRQRAATYSPDGKQVACITDETGEQEIALYDAAGKDKHKILSKHGKGWLFAPLWSDDGKQIAFADMTGALFVVNVESGETKTIDQDKNWELTEYQFSPDSKWIAYSKVGENHVQSMYIAEIATGKITTVSGGFTSDYSPAWDPNGKYLFMLSNRVFNPVLDELDRAFLVTRTSKPVAVILAKDGKSPFLPEEVLGEDEEDADDKVPTTGPATAQAGEVKEDALKGDEDKADDDKPDIKKIGKAKKKKKPVTDLKIDVDNIAQRVVEFPIEPNNCGALLAGDKRVFWVTTPTRGMLDDDEEAAPGDRRPTGKLRVYDFKDRKEEVLIEGIRSYSLSRDGTKLAWQKDKEILIADSSKKPGDDIEEKVALKGLPLQVDPNDEWRQIFEEAWRLQRDFYWAENMVGVDWPEMRNRYEVLLGRVSTRGELNDLIGQLIGELGTSHTYVFGGDSAFQPPNPVPVGVLGANIELDKATGLHKFSKVLRAENWETDIVSPLTMSHANVKDGEFLIAINDKELKATDNADSRFTNLSGVLVRLKVCSKPDKSDARDIDIVTLTDDTDLRYADWCRRNREYVDQKSGGKIGYFHLPDMGSAGLVKFIKGFYPQYNKDALIIDDRNNHGGFVSQMLIEKLNRKVWAYDSPRRGMVGTYPDRVQVGYKCVLINEHAGSDGDIFPDSFRTLGLGPLIGKRTWGGVIGIRMDKAFVDNGSSSQPEFAWWDSKRGWSLENRGVEPDIEVEYRPEDYIAGRDPQLDRGIEEMMKKLKESPIEKPKAPPLPIRVPQPTADNR